MVILSECAFCTAKQLTSCMLKWNFSDSLFSTSVLGIFPTLQLCQALHLRKAPQAFATGNSSSDALASRCRGRARMERMEKLPSAHIMDGIWYLWYKYKWYNICVYNIMYVYIQYLHILSWCGFHWFSLDSMLCCSPIGIWPLTEQWTRFTYPVLWPNCTLELLEVWNRILLEDAQ